MSHHVTENPIGKLVIFTPSIQIWSGGIKVDRATDLKKVQDELPPESIVSDGRKTLIDLHHLNPFLGCRKKVQRLLSRVGFQLTPNAYAVPEDLAEEVASELDAIGAEFDSYTPQFLGNLKQYYNDHIAANKKWKELLKNHQPEPEAVRARLKFNVGAFRMSPPDDDNPDSLVSKKFGESIGAVPSLLEDIASSAQIMLKGPLGKGTRIGHSQARNLRSLVTKLSSFGFLDYRVGPAADSLESMLDVVPADKDIPLSTGNIAVLITVAQILSDPERILEMADLCLDDDDQSTDQTASSVTPPPATQAPREPAFAIDGF